MRFKEHFKHSEIKEILSDLYETVIYNWEEYNPSVCDDEEELKQLGNQLLIKLNEAQELASKMNIINVDSFGC